MTQICDMQDCGGRTIARNLCSRHYQRLMRHGDPLGGGAARFDSDAARWQELWRRLDRQSSPEGCWIYRGPLTSGYGTHHYEKKNWRVHRLVYTILVGPVSDNLQLDHLCHTQAKNCLGGNSCRHRACCNPKHLQVVTHSENVGRGVRTKNETCSEGHIYDLEIFRRGGIERRCSVCVNRRRRENRQKARTSRGA